MNRTAVIITAAISFACVVSVYMVTAQGRYCAAVGRNNLVYQIDTRTGKSWVLLPGGKFRVREPAQSDVRDSPGEAELPKKEVEKITGKASPKDANSFEGRLYNGTEWTLTRAIVTISAERDGKPQWTHDFAVNLHIAPLTTGRFSFEIPEGPERRVYATSYIRPPTSVWQMSWSLKRVFGVK